MVPGAGLEPARSRLRGILSPLCLPVSPPGPCAGVVAAAVPIVVSAVLEIKREGVTRRRGPKPSGKLNIDFDAPRRYVAVWRE